MTKELCRGEREGESVTLREGGGELFFVISLPWHLSSRRVCLFRWERREERQRESGCTAYVSVSVDVVCSSSGRVECLSGCVVR